MGVEGFRSSPSGHRTHLRFQRAIWSIALAFILLIAMSGPSAGANGAHVGRVVGVTDGDTLTLLTRDRRQLRVRLVEIDAPEKRQPYGQKAKQQLSELVFDREIRVVSAGEDRYGRTLGRVYLGSRDVNAEMVRLGAAWAFRRYLTDDRLLRIEAGARAAKRGLWALPASQTIAPWDWRRG